MLNNFINALNSFFKFMRETGIGIFNFVSGFGGAAMESYKFVIGVAIIATFVYIIIELRSEERNVIKARHIMVAFGCLYGGIMAGAQASNSNPSNEDNVSTILIYLADSYIR